MSRATFGEFLQAARRYLDGPVAPRHAAGTGGSAEEVSSSLLRVVTIMGRYLQDITPPLGAAIEHANSPSGSWAQACLQATDAAASAARLLSQHQPPEQWPPAP